MYALGITVGGESGAALFKEQTPICAVNEERLSRLKRDDAYPDRSIEWCLNRARIGSEQIEMICYGFSGGIRQGEAFDAFCRSLSRSTMELGKEAAEIVMERLTTENRIDGEKRREFFEKTRQRFPNTPIFSCHHHESHQANAFWPSPFAEALVVTADGRGDFQSFTISKASRSSWQELYSLSSWESFGYFYGRLTELCGFKPNRHEGKITGLAAKGSPERAMALIDKMLSVEDGQPRFHLGEYYRPFFTNYSSTLKMEAAGYVREDLAAAAQARLETAITHLIRMHLGQTSLRNVCVSGGVFANVKLNQRILALPEVDELFVYPNMSDGGLCTGAVYRWLSGQVEAFQPGLATLYLGPIMDPEALRSLVKSNGYDVERPDDIIGATINALQNKRIVGMLHGKTEFGPRALGNRSILADPAVPGIGSEINRRLNRDGFMPFAPSMASQLASHCLCDYKEETLSSRHMTLSYDTTAAFQADSPAVVHVDGTARPNVVVLEDNPFYHELLTRWHRQSGRLSLLNTSFNRHEEPILATSSDVTGIIENKVVDTLVFPPYIAELT